jgi:hypothetical protein
MLRRSGCGRPDPTRGRPCVVGAWATGGTHCMFQQSIPHTHSSPDASPCIMGIGNERWRIALLGVHWCELESGRRECCCGMWHVAATKHYKLTPFGQGFLANVQICFDRGRVRLPLVSADRGHVRGGFASSTHAPLKFTRSHVHTPTKFTRPQSSHAKRPQSSQCVPCVHDTHGDSLANACMKLAELL